MIGKCLQFGWLLLFNGHWYAFPLLFFPFACGYLFWIHFCRHQLILNGVLPFCRTLMETLLRACTSFCELCSNRSVLKSPVQYLICYGQVSSLNINVYIWKHKFWICGQSELNVGACRSQRRILMTSPHPIEVLRRRGKISWLSTPNQRETSQSILHSPVLIFMVAFYWQESRLSFFHLLHTDQLVH